MESLYSHPYKGPGGSNSRQISDHDTESLPVKCSFLLHALNELILLILKQSSELIPVQKTLLKADSIVGVEASSRQDITQEIENETKNSSKNTENLKDMIRIAEISATALCYQQVPESLRTKKRNLASHSIQKTEDKNDEKQSTLRDEVKRNYKIVLKREYSLIS